ncbi:MAG: MBL fold metallo-hydrolase [Granulosicoccus sp.]
MKTHPLLSACLFSLLLASLPASAQLFDGCPSEPILERFEEFGKTGRMPPDLGKWLNTPDAQYIEPWKPFDNVDYVGICWVSAWLIHTDDGVVLIDTLYGPFTEQLLENIDAVGVDLADIKYVLITHGHRDHAGGAAKLKPLLPNAQFVMTKTGWDEAKQASEQSQPGRRAWTMIEPELAVAEGDLIKLGSNSFKVIETPGHTWGTASYLYDVVDGDSAYRAITIGGLGLNAIEGPTQVEAYIDSVDKVAGLVNDPQTQVQVHLTTHGFSNNLEENRQKLAKRKSGEDHVFVDPKALLNQVEILRAGAVERLDTENNK